MEPVLPMLVGLAFIAAVAGMETLGAEETADILLGALILFGLAAFFAFILGL